MGIPDRSEADDAGSGFHDMPSKSDSKTHHDEMEMTSITKVVSADNSSREKDGLNVGQTAFFIMGSIAGSGVVALPSAILGTGWIGLVLLAFFCIPATYSGICLGKCWVMMEERYEDCRKAVRQPYQTIGERSFGKWLSIVITVCIQLNLLGVCVVYTLLVAGMFADLFKDVWAQSICYWDMIVAVIFIPMSWLGTPKDFWPLAVGAALSIVCASILLTVQAIIDSNDVKYDHVHFPDPDFKSFTLAMGTILFSYGGATALPTFQNDMKNRKNFKLAATLGFTGSLAVYFPVAVSGYLVYGNMVTSNIAQTISNGPMRIAVQTLIIFHLLCALVLVSNPAFQTFEDILKIKPGFGVIKCGFRTIVVLGILFMGETVPSFGVILDLLGGSLNPVLCFILPVVCYVKLVTDQSKHSTVGVKKRTIALHEWVFMAENVIISTLVGIAATVAAVEELIAPDAFGMPCYVDLVPKPS